MKLHKNPINDTKAILYQSLITCLTEIAKHHDNRLKLLKKVIVFQQILLEGILSL